MTPLELIAFGLSGIVFTYLLTKCREDIGILRIKIAQQELVTTSLAKERYYERKQEEYARHINNSFYEVSNKNHADIELLISELQNLSSSINRILDNIIKDKES